MTNIVSGFLITDRMLRMFREKERKSRTDAPRTAR
jgi:NAD/NADP transhydrogenase alpha subunit